MSIFLTPEQLQGLTQMGALNPQTAEGLQQRQAPNPQAIAQAKAIDYRDPSYVPQGLGAPQPGTTEHLVSKGVPTQPEIAAMPAPKPRRKKQRRMQPDSSVAASLVDHMTTGGTGALPPGADPLEAGYIPFSMLPRAARGIFGSAVGAPIDGLNLRKLDKNQLNIAIRLYQMGQREAEQTRQAKMQQEGVTEADLQARAQAEAARYQTNGG